MSEIWREVDGVVVSIVGDEPEDEEAAAAAVVVVVVVIIVETKDKRDEAALADASWTFCASWAGTDVFGINPAKNDEMAPATEATDLFPSRFRCGCRIRCCCNSLFRRKFSRFIISCSSFRIWRTLNAYQTE